MKWFGEKPGYANEWRMTQVCRGRYLSQFHRCLLSRSDGKGIETIAPCGGSNFPERQQFFTGMFAFASLKKKRVLHSFRNCGMFTGRDKSWTWVSWNIPMKVESGKCNQGECQRGKGGVGGGGLVVICRCLFWQATLWTGGLFAIDTSSTASALLTERDTPHRNTKVEGAPGQVKTKAQVAPQLSRWLDRSTWWKPPSSLSWWLRFKSPSDW